MEQHLLLELAHGAAGLGAVRQGVTDHHRQEVVGRALALLLEQTHRVGGHGRPGLDGPHRCLARVVVLVVERGVGPVEEEVTVLLGDAQQRCHRLERQFGGDVDEEVARPGSDGGVEDLGAPHPQLGLEGAQGPRADRRGDEPSDLPVPGIVLHVHEHPGGEPGGQVLDQRAAAGAATAPGRRQQVGVPRPPRNVVMARETPEPFTVGGGGRGRVPEDRGGVAEQLVGLVRRTVGEPVRVGEVEVVEVGHPHLPSSVGAIAVRWAMCSGSRSTGTPSDPRSVSSRARCGSRTRDTAGGRRAPPPRGAASGSSSDRSAHRRG